MPRRGYDSWLEHFYGDRLAEIEAACATAQEPFKLFRGLDADLWALLLTQEYELYPNIRSTLPDVPDSALQSLYNGTSGAALAAQSVAFYTKLQQRYERHGTVPLDRASVLDFGCGWGRLTRFLARDVEPGRLYGCDPVEDILEVCRKTTVPATLARSDFVPQRLPFEQSFDLAYAFSVFTHVSEPAHEACLRALHQGLEPGGILIVTIRPPEYLNLCDLMEPADRLDEPQYLFVPHAADPSHPQYAGPEMTFGETVITLAYVRERWAESFELLAVDLLVHDLYQVVLTLRRA